MMTHTVQQAMQQYDQQGCLHEQFVKQAKATPDATAVVTHSRHKVKKKKLTPFIALL
jgi:DNA-binding transcriptional regulator YhcF (GntR family)